MGNVIWPDRTFVLLLPCGCPATYVHAVNMDRAWEILFGGVILAPWISRENFHELSADQFPGIRDELTRNPGQRFECRSEHVTRQ